MKKIIFNSIVILALIGMGKAFSQTSLSVNSNATSEAKAMLKYIYSISGKQTLTALHEQLYVMSKNTDSIAKLTGKYPSIWGGEFGFSDERHDIDNIKYRPQLLEEIIKQHAAGAMITITYHQAPPTIGEPCDFRPGVLGKLTAEEYHDLLTPGTKIYNTWKGMVDKLAGLFKNLQDKNIPVFLRPYHEMNGGWFWWSGKNGDSSYIKLYRQLYHYLTDQCKIDNLIWVWSPTNQHFNLNEYFPGKEYVDIFGFDIYPPHKGATAEETFKQNAYDTLLSFASGKPIVIGECSTMPTIEILGKQPEWAWMMCWVDLTFKGNSNEDIRKIYNDKRIISRVTKGLGER
jgi:mannan endo-1,4-beta-mannosidase